LARLELVTLVHIRTVEASMHGTFEKSRETVKRIYRNWGIGMFALPVLVVIALIGLVQTHSDPSRWMSEALQTEVSGANHGPDVAPPQLAHAPRDIRTVKAF
jgi:hypothetical protein